MSMYKWIARQRNSFKLVIQYFQKTKKISNCFRQTMFTVLLAKKDKNKPKIDISTDLVHSNNGERTYVR